MLVKRITLSLLALAAVAGFVGPILEAPRRDREAPVRTYIEAIERDDLEAALEAIAPELREIVRPRVELQLGSRYRVEVLVLGAPSIIESFTHLNRDHAWASLVAQVTPESGETWKSTGVVGLVERNGRWYLLEPPFA